MLVWLSSYFYKTAEILLGFFLVVLVVVTCFSHSRKLRCYHRYTYCFIAGSVKKTTIFWFLITAFQKIHKCRLEEFEGHCGLCILINNINFNSAFTPQWKSKCQNLHETSNNFCSTEYTTHLPICFPGIFALFHSQVTIWILPIL